MHLENTNIDPSKLRFKQKSWMKGEKLFSTFYVSYLDNDNNSTTLPLHKLGYDLVQGVNPVKEYSESPINRKWKDLAIALDDVEPESSHLDMTKKYAAVLTTRMQGKRLEVMKKLYEDVAAEFVKHIEMFTKPDFAKLVQGVDNIDELYEFDKTFPVIVVVKQEGKTLNDLRAMIDYKQALDKESSSLSSKLWFNKFETDKDVFYSFYLGADTSITGSDGDVPLKNLICKRFEACIHVGFPSIVMGLNDRGGPNRLQMRTLIHTMVVRSVTNMSLKPEDVLAL